MVLQPDGAASACTHLDVAVAQWFATGSNQHRWSMSVYGGVKWIKCTTGAFITRVDTAVEVVKSPLVYILIIVGSIGCFGFGTYWHMAPSRLQLTSVLMNQSYCVNLALVSHTNCRSRCRARGPQPSYQKRWTCDVSEAARNIRKRQDLTKLHESGR
jgi:hypothetical protein